MSATPRTDAQEFRSDMDNYGQRSRLVNASFARELETELAQATELARKLYDQLCHFDCDDDGQELKEEARSFLSIP